MFNSNYTTPATLTLFITGETATNGVVSIPGLNFSQSFSVTPGSVSTVTLPAAAQMSQNDTVTNLGVRVIANAKVAVYGLNRIQSSTDAFLALPTDILGKEYLNLSYRDLSSAVGSQLGIVGTQAGTVVTITPTSQAGSRAAGVPYNIVLNAGQTYQLRSTSGTGDLTGTVVTSTAPVAVFGSHMCANVPTGYGYCDHLVEQLPPTSTWGKSFVTMPLATRAKGDTFRVLASTNGTSVSINGTVVASLNRGKFFETILSTPSLITSTQPVLVAQYSNGTAFDNITSDPFESLVPPSEQFLSAYTVATPAGFTNYINVVVPNSAVGSTAIDGVAIPAAAFTAIPGSTFSGAQRSVTQGTHTLTSTQPFGATMYGFAAHDSYGYPGGTSLTPVATVSSILVSPKTDGATVGSQRCVTATLRDQFAAPVSGVRIDFTVTGVNPRTSFTTADANGQGQHCFTGMKVGIDTVVAKVGTLTDSATQTWTPIASCDIDGDADIDTNDLNLIRLAIGQAVAAGDPRDSTGDRIVTINDVRACTLRCTRASCAVNVN